MTSADGLRPSHSDAKRQISALMARWQEATEQQLEDRRALIAGQRSTSRSRQRRIAIVTDSSSALPVLDDSTELALGEVGESVVSIPIPVMIGDHVYTDPTAELEADLPLALAQGKPVRTSRPSPGRLLQAYRSLENQGYAGIVYIHIATGLSGTVEAARLARKEITIPVSVVDSAHAGMSLGHAVIEAAITAALGGSVEEVAKAASLLANGSESLFVVPHLEQLRRGGRINPVASLVGSWLWVKPLLTIRDGHIQVLELPRTLPRAVERLYEHIRQAAQQRKSPRIAVHYAGNPDQALAFARSLDGLSSLPVPVIDLPAAISAHVGLGTLGVSLSSLEV